MSYPSDLSVSMSKPLSGNPPSLSNLTSSPHEHFDDPQGLHLQVNFAWTKFRNIISEVNSEQLTPIYIQHFRPTKPQLRFNLASDETTRIASGTINNFSISAECTIDTQTIPLKPLKRWETQYNYLSTALSPDPKNPVPVSWIANMSLKLWDFVCLDAQQMPIAKFSVNWWAITQVGNFYFANNHVSAGVRDEVVVTGITLLYVMTTRMSNPLHLAGAMTAKPGKVEAGEEVESEDRKKR
ncbi:hypothetical protein GQ44DRAFT_701184 [Phaeosphaeriaceae sp. PMI808]|nr:hypothetical protein GQ44DRAFT_701184 [Phaeosphaeriaceae sp. PMI808]